jgi:RNA polymerase sigma factor (sigma-70 family)
MDTPDDLRFLGPDPERAAASYVELHQFFTRYFEIKACVDPGALADATLRRGLRRLREGTVLTTSLRFYLMGIARNIVREQRHARRNQVVPLAADMPGPDVASAVEQGLSIDQVLAKVSPDERRLLQEYYCGTRSELASRLGLTSTALRVRVHRLVKRLHERFGNAG